MNKYEIIESIKILNESFNSDFLQINKININTNLFKKIIKKKKSKELMNIFKNFKNIQKTSSSSSQTQSQSSNQSSSSPEIDDSIAVTNFSIPSSIYNQNSNQIRNQINK